MVAVPVALPLTTPAVVTLATALLLLLQVPPLTVEVSVLVAPVHNAVVPLIVPADAPGLTAIVAVAVAVPQLLVTV